MNYPLMIWMFNGCCIFVNDVVNSPLQKDSLLNLFADDLIVCTSGRTVEEVECKMNYNVNVLSDWYKRNRLKIHPKKTKFMVLGSRDQLRTLWTPFRTQYYAW